ncbi:protein-disulfide reductase DsbD domain-containing protein [Yoonia sp. MH D7]
MKHTLSITALLCAFASTLSAGPNDHATTLTVLTGWQTKSGSHMAGLRIDLADGWKTYWRAPGDAGIPPQITWGGSTNIASAAFHWPVPVVFDQDGMRSIGYHDSVTIPIELFPNAAGEMRLAGQIEIGVCDQICVPVTLDFDAVLPTGGKRDAAIAASLLNRPKTATEAGIDTMICAIEPINGGMKITTTTALTQNGPEAIIIETSNPYVWVSEPEVTRTATEITATSELIHVDGTSFAVDRSGIRMTVLGAARAIDIVGCAAG